MIPRVQKSIDNMTEYWYKELNTESDVLSYRPVELDVIENIINQVVLSKECIPSDKLDELMVKWEGFVTTWICNVKRGKICQN